MRRRIIFLPFLWLSLWFCLGIPTPGDAQSWGTVMSVLGKTNIRANRSMKSRITGELKAGEKIRADFLKNDWYAVFNLNEKYREETKALGYVHALNLSPPVSPLAGAEAILIKDMTFKKEKDGHEKFLIEFNRFNEPKIFSMDGKKPRIVIDIHNISSVRSGLSRIDVKGTLVKQIRTALDRKTNSMRIVIDVEANRNYEVDQTFYKAENLFVVDISEETKKPAETKSKAAKP
jgi:hypothetical protein